MLGHRTKAFTLTLDDEDRTLDGFMDEEKKIPFKALNFTKTKASFFYSHALLPSFLQTYGPQLHRIHTPSGFFLHLNADSEVDEVPPEKELAFYQGLPNLTHLSLFNFYLKENVLLPLPTIEKEKLPFLQHLHSFSIELAVTVFGGESTEVIRNMYFLQHCPSLRKLSLHDMSLLESVKVLTTLGDKFAAMNGWKGGGTPPTLRIFIKNTLFQRQNPRGHMEELREIDEGMINNLLEELAASDGRISIETMPITLLDGAVRLFSKQRGKLQRFGKCVRSLIGFSDSLYEVQLPNLRELRVYDLLFLGKEREGDYTETVSWPKLDTIKIQFEGQFGNDSESEDDDADDNEDSESDDDDNDDDDAPAVPVKEDMSYMKKLVFESGLRARVQRLDYDFGLKLLRSDDEAPSLLRNLPNLTQLRLQVFEEDAEPFRSLLRNLPTSVPKLQLLGFHTHFPLKDEDFLGMGDECCCVPPLLQLSCNYYQ
jgi:hypothetical protein